MNLNNKGQSLVMFILLMPVMILILVLVVDVGNMVSTKLELNSINKIVIASGLEDMENSLLEDEIKDLILKNNKDIDKINIKIENGKIQVSLLEYSKSVFGRIVGFEGYQIVSEYIGYIENDEKVIRGLR